MNVTGWKYYNHAVIPSTAHHITPNIESINDGSIWKTYNRALFVRYTTDFDCGYETEWFYLCRKKPFSFDMLSKSAKRSIRKALSQCYVKKIDPDEYLDDMWRVYTEAIERYSHKELVEREESQFKTGIQNRNFNREYWAAFETGTDRMIGYDGVDVYEDYVDDTVGKYSANSMKLGASDAITYTICEHYLAMDGIRYVCDGEKAINHETNVQNYLEQRFKFEKLYCHLHIVYRPVIRMIIPILFFIRKPLMLFDRISVVHMINSVLKMEAISRQCEEDKRYGDIR